MRVLTQKFGAYAVAKWEKETGKSILDLLDVGNLELNKIADIIKLGLPKFAGESEEEHLNRVYERIDNYLQDDSHSLIDLFLQVLREFDLDFKILRAAGMNIDTLEKELKDEMAKNLEKVKEVNNIE